MRYRARQAVSACLSKDPPAALRWAVPLPARRLRLGLRRAARERKQAAARVSASSFRSMRALLPGHGRPTLAAVQHDGLGSCQPRIPGPHGLTQLLLTRRTWLRPRCEPLLAGDPALVLRSTH